MYKSIFNSLHFPPDTLPFPSESCADGYKDCGCAIKRNKSIGTNVILNYYKYVYYTCCGICAVYIKTFFGDDDGGGDTADRRRARAAKTTSRFEKG